MRKRIHIIAFQQMIAPQMILRCHHRLPMFLVLFAPCVQGQDDAATLDNVKAQDVPFAVVPRKEKKEDGLTRNVNRELARLKDFTNLDDDAITNLRLSLQPLIQTTLAEHPEATRPSVPVDNILGVIVETVKKTVGNQDDLDRYLEDLDKRKSFAEQMAAQTYLYYHDSFVGLNSKQWEELHKGSAALYRQGDLDPGDLDLRGHIAPRVSEAELKLLKDILTTDQLSYLDKFTPIRSDPESPEELTQTLRLVAEMKIQQLDSEVSLTPAQKQKLDFVSKRTVVPNVVERRIKANSLREMYIEARLKDPDAEFTEEERHEVWNISRARIPFLFADERWQTFVKSTLNEEQANKWKQFTDRRLESAMDAHAFAAQSLWFWALELTAEQQMAAHQLFRRAVNPGASKLENAFHDEVVFRSVITEQEFISVIGKNNWAKLPLFIRQRIAAKEGVDQSDATKDE